MSSLLTAGKILPSVILVAAFHFCCCALDPNRRANRADVTTFGDLIDDGRFTLEPMAAVGSVTRLVRKMLEPAGGHTDHAARCRRDSHSDKGWTIRVPLPDPKAATALLLMVANPGSSTRRWIMMPDYATDDLQVGHPLNHTNRASGFPLMSTAPTCVRLPKPPNALLGDPIVKQTRSVPRRTPPWMVKAYLPFTVRLLQPWHGLSALTPSLPALAESKMRNFHWRPSRFQARPNTTCSSTLLT